MGKIKNPFRNIPKAGAEQTTDGKRVFTVLLGIFAFLCVLAVTLQSPLRPFSKAVIPQIEDSSVFLYIGNEMLSGAVPYRDMFDHKGPLLYFIQYVGLLIGGGNSVGVWVVELIFLLTAVFVTDRSIRLFTKNILVRGLSICLFALFLSGCFEGGNFTEEYALPFISFGLYALLSYIKTNTGGADGKISRAGAILNGLSFAAVLLLRVNMAAVWVVGCVFIFFHNLYKKRVKAAFEFAGLFVIGCLLIIAPTVVYFIANNALSDFINDYLVFNFAYTDSYGGVMSVLKVCNFLIGIFFINRIALFLLIAVIASVQQRRLTAAVLLAVVIVSLLSASVSGREYAHYGMVLAPVFAIVFAYEMFAFASKYGQNLLIKNNSRHFALTALLVLMLCSPNIISMGRLVLTAGKDNSTEQFTNLIEAIKENSDEDDRVFVFGSRASVYLESGRSYAGKYFYQTQIADISERVREELFEEVVRNPPDLVCVYDWPLSRHTYTGYEIRLGEILFGGETEYVIVYDKINGDDEYPDRDVLLKRVG